VLHLSLIISESKQTVRTGQKYKVTCDCNDTTRVQHQSAVINISTLRHG